jgi:hypothetical protein
MLILERPPLISQLRDRIVSNIFCINLAWKENPDLATPSAKRWHVGKERLKLTVVIAETCCADTVCSNPASSSALPTSSPA